jgi:hypothetical protein
MRVQPRVSSQVLLRPQVKATGLAAIEEDKGDGEDNGDEHQLPGNNPISKDGSVTLVSMARLNFPFVIVGVCVGVGSGTLG